MRFIRLNSLSRVNSIRTSELTHSLFTFSFVFLLKKPVYFFFQITQCTREARTGVNLTIDSDNVRFYTNVTSCILAKTRCGTFNPITGDPQAPGYTSTGLRISNALQFSATGELRILAFSAATPVSSSFCTTSSNLTQTSWLTNVC